MAGKQQQGWKDFLWPLGGTIFGLLVVPIAIAQYPEFFNKNERILPASVVVVLFCWIVPLLLQHRTRKLYSAITAVPRFGYPLCVGISLIAVAGFCFGGRALFNFHIDHLRNSTESHNATAAATNKPENKPPTTGANASAATTSGDGARPSSSSGENAGVTASLAVEVRRAIPPVEFSFQSSGEKKQRIASSVIPELLELEPKPTGVKESDLPMDVKVGAGTITVLRFGREAKGGYMVFDTHDVPVGTSIRGRILGYEQPGSPPAPKAEFTQNKTRTPPVSAAQDNSVHIGAGATVDQNSKGDCSPNIIGGSNTVNCPMTFGSIPARVLSSEQAETLGQFAGIAPGKVRIICMQAAPDAWKLGGQIANTLQSADWIIKSQERLTQVGGTLYGVEVQWYGERATPSSPVPLPISTPWGALTVGLQKAKFDTVHATRCRSATKIQ